MTTRYRNKPIVVEAEQYDRSNADAIAEWCGGVRHVVEMATNTHLDNPEWIEIPTVEGVMRAAPGDWIIKSTEGEFYRCKPSRFATTFEPAND